MKHFRRAGLWRDRAFLHLWIGQAISQVGSQVSYLALPLLAVVVLHATPLEMGLLTATGAVPWLLFGLHAGALLGGWAGQALGLRETLIMAACGELLAALWVCASPVWRITALSDVPPLRSETASRQPAGEPRLCRGWTAPQGHAPRVSPCPS